jgi:hypothetical protein
MRNRKFEEREEIFWRIYDREIKKEILKETLIKDSLIKENKDKL